MTIEYFVEMNRIVDEIETIAGDSNGQICYDKFLTLIKKSDK